MKTIRTLCVFLAAAFFLFEINAFANETLKLPKPGIHGQLMKALNNRSSQKGFSDKELSDKTLSELLWAAFGINNQKTGRRTAPSAFNIQEIDIYVLSSSGSYLYNPKDHSLEQISTVDNRNLAATQSYSKTAPVHFIYVADFDKTSKRYPPNYVKQAENWANMHTGFIGQNVHLYCAVNGLGAVVRSAGNEDKLRDVLKLRENQGIIITQVIGYPPKR